MMKNYDESVEINDNLNLPCIPDHPYSDKILTKTIYMSKIHSNQSINYLLRITKVRIKKLKIQKAFINYSQTIDDFYQDLEG